MSVRVCTRALARAVLALLLAFLPAVASAQNSFKVAYWNIQSGKGEPALPGHPVTFYDTTNCTDVSKPINGWYVGLVQKHLIKTVGSDPRVIALGLGESWATVCASPENVRKVLGWKARSSERNGVALVARHGFAGPEEWVQLDTSRNTNPPDTMWVLRVPVCMDAACSQSIDIFSAHWMGTGTDRDAIYDYQAQQTVSFMQRAGGQNPHVLVGDLNVWEGVAQCSKQPQPNGLSRLRNAGYVDAWPAANGAAEGYTGMLNRVGCGTPEGYAFARIDYAWTPPGMQPLSMTRLGMEPPGDEQPSDHYGFVVEYPWPGAPEVIDTSAPLVALTSPATGSAAIGTTTIAASAHDNVGVTRVDILEDGAAAHVLTGGTWQVACAHLSNMAAGTHTVQARAFDAAGNSGLSPVVSVIVPSSTPPPVTPAGEIVLYAEDATLVQGNWQIVADANAAGGARAWNRDQGAAKLGAPLASPASYFELTFNAEAGRPYRLWLRGIADRNHWANDSVYVQFSGSTTAVGSAVYRIGTTNGATVNLEDGAHAGLSGWGWQDNGYGAGVLGPQVYFATSGPQTIRIQSREDGISIDQVVLSPGTYLRTAPGALKNDATILTSGSSPAESHAEIIVRASAATALAGGWQKVSDATAAGGLAVRHPDVGGAKVSAPLAAPASYVEFTFQAEAGRKYRLWIRARADRDYWGNDSVFVQFSGSVDSSGRAVHRIGTTSGTFVNLEDAVNAGIAGWGWQDNGYGAGILGPLVSFDTTGTQRIRIQTREDGLRIDQVVLSSSKYLTAAPGALKNDATIIP